MTLTKIFVLTLALGTQLTLCPAFADKEEVYVPSCKSGTTAVGEYCLNSKLQLTTKEESEYTNADGEAVKELKTDRKNRKEIFEFFAQWKDQYGNSRDLRKTYKMDAEGKLVLENGKPVQIDRPKCDDATQPVGTICVRNWKLGKITGKDEYGNVVDMYATRKQLYKYINNEAGFKFTTTEPKPEAIKIAFTPPKDDEIMAPPLEEVVVANPLKIEMKPVDKSCTSSAKTQLGITLKPEQEVKAKAFLKIQTELTQQRAHYNFLERISLVSKDKTFYDKDKAAVEARIVALIKEKAKYKEFNTSFENAPLTDITLNLVMPNVKNILETQKKYSAKAKHLAFGQSDLKLLTWNAEGNEPIVLNFVKEVNDYQGKTLTNKIVSANKKTSLAAVNINRAVDAVIAAKPDCTNTFPCAALSSNPEVAKLGALVTADTKKAIIDLRTKDVATGIKILNVKPVNPVVNPIVVNPAKPAANTPGLVEQPGDKDRKVAAVQDISKFKAGVQSDGIASYHKAGGGPTYQGKELSLESVSGLFMKSDPGTTIKFGNKCSVTLNARRTVDGQYRYDLTLGNGKTISTGAWPDKTSQFGEYHLSCSPTLLKEKLDGEEKYRKEQQAMKDKAKQEVLNEEQRVKDAAWAKKNTPDALAKREILTSQMTAPLVRSLKTMYNGKAFGGATEDMPGTHCYVHVERIDPNGEYNLKGNGLRVMICKGSTGFSTCNKDKAIKTFTEANDFRKDYESHNGPSGVNQMGNKLAEYFARETYEKCYIR